SYKRVRLPFSDYAICAMGGTILKPDGSPDPEWHRHITSASAAEKGNLEHLARLTKEAAHRLGLDSEVVTVGDLGCDLYVNVREHNAEGLQAIADLLAKVLPLNWHLHHNGRNIAIMPPFLGKDKAATYFLQ